MRERNLLINSIIIRITASLLTTLIHELGHFITSVYLGNSATLYHNMVETHTIHIDPVSKLYIPLAGPVISLIQGIFCFLFYRRIKDGVWSLFFLWLGLSGLMVFFGYVMIGPFASNGDTGKVLQLLEIPFIWQIVIAIGALGIFTLLLLHFHRHFERFIPQDIDNDKNLRIKWAKILIMYPVLAGIVVNTLLQFPVLFFISILPTLTMPFSLFLVYGKLITSNNVVYKRRNKIALRLSIPLIVILLIAIFINRYLVFGFRLPIE